MDMEEQGAILVVDDKPENLQLLLDILAERRYDVRLATDGELALQFARSTPPDLILLDIKMPDLDGYTVCEHLKADDGTRDIPVIFISALGDVENKVKGFEVGGIDYITKPFQAKEVLARVNTHVSLRRLQQELQAANRHLQETNQQLAEANACKDKFFSIIAHDLRNPFDGLLGLTRLLIENFDQYPPDKIKFFLDKMLASTEKTYALLTNLLTWSQLERGLMACTPKIIPLVGVVAQNIHLLAAQAEQKGIRLDSRIPSGTTVYADENMLTAVIRNLLSNAVKFMKTDGAITVLSRQDGNMVEFIVSDTGIGMSPEQIATLFRIDARSHRQGTAGEHGTGLGLILCKELVEQNGGSIRVESAVGHGAAFWVSLPKPAQP